MRREITAIYCSCPNTYNLTASARGFRSQTVQVTIADGQTLTQNFALAPAPLFEDGDLNITAESCQPNNAIDPGETVTVNIGLANVGLANTTNLVATLLPTGGVTNPSRTAKLRRFGKRCESLSPVHIHGFAEFELRRNNKSDFAITGRRGKSRNGYD